MQSPPLALPKATLNEARSFAKKVAEYLDCEDGDVECLMSKSADEIVEAQASATGDIFLLLRNPFLSFQPWGPVLGRNDLSVLERLAAGDFQKKPVMLGGTTEEARWSVFAFLSFEIPKVTLLPLYVLAFGFENAVKISWKYNDDYPDARDTLSEVLGDYLWTCPIRKAARDIESHETLPVYHYVFDHAINDSAVWDFIEEWCRDYSCHDAELFFLFYTLPLEGFSYTDEEKELAKSLIQFWGNFIHTGNPNRDEWRNDVTRVFRSAESSSIVKHLQTTRLAKRSKRTTTDWPSYEARSGWPSMWFKTPSNGVLHRFRARYCHLWDKVGYNN